MVLRVAERSKQLLQMANIDGVSHPGLILYAYREKLKNGSPIKSKDFLN